MGANLASQDDQGHTALHFRETLEEMDILNYLVHNGAPVDVPSKVKLLLYA